MRYTCDRFKGFGIPPSIKFLDGVFETDDPEVIAQIEAHEWYGLHIKPVTADTPPPEAPKVRQGGRDTRRG